MAENVGTAAQTAPSPRPFTMDEERAAYRDRDAGPSCALMDRRRIDRLGILDANLDSVEPDRLDVVNEIERSI